MDTPSVEAILKLDVEERLRIVQVIWDSIAADEVPSSDDERREVEQLVAEDDAAPDDVVPWTEAKATLRRRQ